MDIPENPTEITTALSDVDDQWTFYQSRFMRKKKARYVPRIIQVITETMMQNMNEVTQLYKKEDFVNTVFSESMREKLKKHENKTVRLKANPQNEHFIVGWALA